MRPSFLVTGLARIVSACAALSLAACAATPQEEDGSSGDAIMGLPGDTAATAPATPVSGWAEVYRCAPKDDFKVTRARFPKELLSQASAETQAGKDARLVEQECDTKLDGFCSSQQPTFKAVQAFTWNVNVKGPDGAAQPAAFFGIAVQYNFPDRIREVSDPGVDVKATFVRVYNTKGGVVLTGIVHGNDPGYIDWQEPPQGAGQPELVYFAGHAPALPRTPVPHKACSNPRR